MNNSLPLKEILENNIKSCNQMMKVLDKLSSALDAQNQTEDNPEDAESTKELNNSVNFVKGSVNKLEQVLENNLNLITKMKEENQENNQ